MVHGYRYFSTLNQADNHTNCEMFAANASSEMLIKPGAFCIEISIIRFCIAGLSKIPLFATCIQKCSDALCNFVQ